MDYVVVERCGACNKEINRYVAHQSHWQLELFIAITRNAFTVIS